MLSKIVKNAYPRQNDDNAKKLSNCKIQMNPYICEYIFIQLLISSQYSSWLSAKHMCLAPWKRCHLECGFLSLMVLAT